MKLSLGKIRALQQLTKNNKFQIIAIDHRDVFIDMIKNANKFEGVDSVINEKLNILNMTKLLVSGFLVDPHFTLPKGILKEAIPGEIGFMVNIEDNDYSIKNFGMNYCIKDFTVNKIKKIGASAVKLFLNYNPRSSITKKQEKLIEKIANECEDFDIPFLIEPVLYPIVGKEIEPNERVELTKETIKRLSKYKIDIFKIDFPGNIQEFSEEKNISICEEITKLTPAPWVIMSSGISIEHFKRQLELACKGGASGYVVGRALWKEYVLSNEKSLKKKEEMELIKRLETLNEIVDRYASSWNDFLENDYEKIDQSNWYKKI